MDNLEDFLQEEYQIDTRGLTKSYLKGVISKEDFETELDYRKTYGEINNRYDVV